VAAPLGVAHARRQTFTSALQASVHCVSAALRHPGFACSHSPAPGHGQPRAPVPKWPQVFNLRIAKRDRRSTRDAHGQARRAACSDQAARAMDGRAAVEQRAVQP